VLAVDKAAEAVEHRELRLPAIGHKAENRSRIATVGTAGCRDAEEVVRRVDGELAGGGVAVRASWLGAKTVQHGFLPAPAVWRQLKHYAMIISAAALGDAIEVSSRVDCHAFKDFSPIRAVGLRTKIVERLLRPRSF